MTMFKVELLLDLKDAKTVDKILTDALCARGFFWQITRILKKSDIPLCEEFEDLPLEDKIQLDNLLR